MTHSLVFLFFFNIKLDSLPCNYMTSLLIDLHIVGLATLE